MDQPSWMLLRVALETRTLHPAADADRLVLLEDPTPARYRHVLGKIFGFEAALEAALAQTPDLDPALIRGRNRMPLLARDLTALGLSAGEIAKLPRCAAIPRFQTLMRALGWMYVIERNALVHGLVVRHLARHIPVEIQRASSYMTANEGNAGTRLRELGLALGEVGRGFKNADRIVTAATEAFTAQHRWFGTARTRIESPRAERVTA